MPGYAAGTSSLIDLARRRPRKAFPGLWKKIEVLVAEGRLVAPLQACKEIKQKNDELSGRAMKHKTMFKKNTDRIEKVAAKPASEHGSMSSRDASTERADPCAIAPAHCTAVDTLAGKPVAVTEEGARRGRIPEIAQSCGLRHLRLVEVIPGEKWSFG